MVNLRNFNEKDVPILIKYQYPNETMESVLHKIELWNTKDSDGKYFEMFAMTDNEKIVGMVSLYQHNKYIISIGPEVFENYKGQGYGTQAVNAAIEIAKDNGYKIAVAQIRKDNLASIRLHEKLGFEMDHQYINKRGNEVLFYIKSIV